MPFPIAVPIVAGVGIIGTLVALRIRAMSKDAPKSIVGIPPDFKNSPPAPAAIPAGRSTAGVPAITADQFKALDAIRQETIRQDALKGILTLTATNGALFTEKSTQFDLNVPLAIFKEGDDIKGMFMSVDVGLSKKLGVNLDEIATVGNVIFEALDRPGKTHTPGISRDPRKPNVVLDIPNGAITGAGDP